MIRLKQPSLALHSHDVPGYKYQMSTTWSMPKTVRPSDIAYWILHARNHSPELMLHNVVINCHGCAGALLIGEKSWLMEGHVGVFNSLRGKDIGTIWIVACEVASGGAGSKKKKSSSAGRDGKRFCSELAKAAGCNVVAADKTQYVDVSFYLRFCPKHSIDDYEGQAYLWDASGARKTISSNGSGAPGVAS